MSEYNLIYIQKATGKEFRGRIVEPRLTTSIEDPETGERRLLTRHMMNKEFKSCPKNKRKDWKSPMRPRIYAKGANTKTWKEYLGEAT